MSLHRVGSGVVSRRLTYPGGPKFRIIGTSRFRMKSYVTPNLASSGPLSSYPFFNTSHPIPAPLSPSFTSPDYHLDR
ncbi:hypothetical protein LENED_009304 [Lentinula edodes]|uniref:Uncharacterized protein n=1 Tax=Lentinula edodes TaxID=5353 RepID=A0A1Q3EJE0_LENED|nr:hypothetical protein LENED_009304 [Lentinula edodes]